MKSEQERVEAHGIDFDAYLAAEKVQAEYYALVFTDPDGTEGTIRSEYPSALAAAIHAYLVAANESPPPRRVWGEIESGVTYRVVERNGRLEAVPET